MDFDLDLSGLDKITPPAGRRIEAVCAKCSAEFTARRSTAKYCSHACRQAAYADRPPADPDRECVTCGTPIGHMRADAMHCSDACRAESNRWVRSPEAAALAVRLLGGAPPVADA